MPIINLPLPEIDQLIARPVVLAVMEQLKQITNIPQDTDITFVGQGGSRMQYDHGATPQNAPVKLAGDSMLTIEVDEQPDEGMFATTVGNRPEHAPDFVDKYLGVELKPCYAGFDYVVNVVYRTPSRSQAIRWRNDARFKASQSRMVNLHELEYHYQIPTACWQILEHLHTLRENVRGFGQSFEEYRTQGLTTRGIPTSTGAGTHQEILIRERSMRVQGTFDFTFDPQRQDKNEGNGWEVRFVYTFSFHHPNEYSMRFPIIVHNQPIDPKYIPLEVQDPTEADTRMSQSINALHFMEAAVQLQRQTNYAPMVRFPEFDGWTPDVLPPNQRLIASFLLSLEDNAQGVTLLNINELGDYALDGEVRRWLNEVETPYMQLPATSVVQVQLYRNECLSAPQAIEVRKNGDVVLLEKVDARKRYRVTLSVAKKLSGCDRRSILRLSRYPEAICTLIKVMRTSTGEINEMLQQIDITKFASCAIPAGSTKQHAIDNIISMKTVMGLVVMADRLDGGSTDSPGTVLKRENPNI